MHRINRRLLAVAVILITLGGYVAAFALGMAVGRRPASTPTTAPSITPSTTASATPSVSPTPSSTGTLSPTPRPTKTPRPARPILKIGPEISAGTNVPLGRPPVVKLRNVSREYVAQVRWSVGPDCLIVIRFQFDEPSVKEEPRQAARDWYARRRADILAMKAAAAPNIAFETAVNECADQDLDWYVQFSLELIPLMHADGVRCVAGNPAVGNWNEKLWPKFAPVLAILKPDDLLGVHEYWKEPADIDNRWYCGRWSIPDIAAVIGNVKIVVTECGRDGPDSGWRNSIDAGDYLWELETYDALLRQFPNVVGATTFTIDRNWPNHDVYDIWPQVVFRYSLTPTPPATPTATP